MPILTPKEVLARISAASVLKENATDADASRCVSVYPTLKGDGSLVKAGTRINHNGTLKRVAVDLWDTEENSPDNAPNLYEDILYKRGIRIIPETITAGTAFALDEKGWWEGGLYQSTIDNNVWTPTVNPSGWKLIREAKK